VVRPDSKLAHLHYLVEPPTNNVSLLSHYDSCIKTLHACNMKYTDIAFFLRRMYVDDTPIRLFKKNESLGLDFVEKQPMKVHASLWNGEDWATEGGTIKIDWRQAPFVASYRNYSVSACVWSEYGSRSWCGNGASSWMNRGLDAEEMNKIALAKKNYMISNYCDIKGSDENTRKECSREFS